MTPTLGDSGRADRIAAGTTGVGVGLLVFMIVWLIGARVTEKVWGPPSSAVVALVVAVASGILVAVVSGRRLVGQQLSEAAKIPNPGDALFGPERGAV